jgi:hypothetical protein
MPNPDTPASSQPRASPSTSSPSSLTPRNSNAGSPPPKTKTRKKGFLGQHALGISASGILLLWFVLYCFWNPNTHFGSFFGNAIADWSGVVLMVYATKYLYEKGSAESRRPPHSILPRRLEWMRDHSLTIFLGLTWIIWIAMFAKMDPQSRWGQVVGNIVSEWTQALGLVVLTKHMIEKHSKP